MPVAHDKPARAATSWAALVVGVAAFGCYAATARYRAPLNNDTRAAAIAAWQLALHGNATLTAFHTHYAWVYQSHGRYVTDRLPGTIFWATPFYLLLGSRSYPNIYPSALAASLSSAIAVGLAYVLLARLLTRRQALVGSLLFAFATGTWTVSSAQLWTHGPAQAAVLLTLLLVTQDRWLLAGLPAGFAILVRPHLGVVALVLGVVEALRTRRFKPLTIAPAASPAW